MLRISMAVEAALLLLLACFAPLASADPATTLVFTVQPSDTVAGDAIAPALVVEARDSLGSVDTAFI